MSTQILVNELGISTVGISKKRVWAGRVISALPAVFLLSSGINMSMKASFVMEGFAHLGYPERVALGIGIVEFICAALYVIPRTSVLGAVLLTGYLGGATASHVRIGESFIAPLIVGTLVWIGMFLREDRLRAFLPWKGKPGA